MNLANLPQFAIVGFGAHLDKNAVVALENQAAAFRKMKNFAEPAQALVVTPDVRHSKSPKLYINLDIIAKKVSEKLRCLSQELNTAVVIATPLGLVEIEHRITIKVLQNLAVASVGES